MLKYVVKGKINNIRISRTTSDYNLAKDYAKQFKAKRIEVKSNNRLLLFENLLVEKKKRK